MIIFVISCVVALGCIVILIYRHLTGYYRRPNYLKEISYSLKSIDETLQSIRDIMYDAIYDTSSDQD